MSITSHRQHQGTALAVLTTLVVCAAPAVTAHAATVTMPPASRATTSQAHSYFPRPDLRKAPVVRARPYMAAR